MKWEDKYKATYELWEMNTKHIENIIKGLISHIKIQERIFGFKNVKRLHLTEYTRMNYHLYRRHKVYILLMKRELQYRKSYPEYAKFCRQLTLVLANFNNRYDTTFLSAFSDWLEEHKMLVQSRKIRRKIKEIIDSIKYGKIINITKENIYNDVDFSILFPIRMDTKPS
jgi:hypothetical protein